MDMCAFHKLSEKEIAHANPNMTVGPKELEIWREVLDSAFEG
jgi:hypothetical protein